MRPGGELLIRVRALDGIHEEKRHFESLEELYSLCMAIRPPELIEGLTLRGRGPDRQERTLAFEFRSITSS